MAGGRRKKAPKTNKTKSKLARSKVSKDEEGQGMASSAAKVESEKEKPIENGRGEDQNQQVAKSTSSPLESKYVPPFSRSSKISSKNDEKSLGKPQIKASQTLKRRLDENTEEATSENSGSCLLMKSQENFAASSNSANEDNNDEFIHLDKQPKMSAMDDEGENIPSIAEESTTTCENENRSSSEVIQTQDAGEGIKEMAIVEGFIKKVKLENNHSKHTCDDNEVGEVSNDPRTSPPPQEKFCSGYGDSQPDNLSPIDELVEACVNFLVKKAEKVTKTDVQTDQTRPMTSEKDPVASPKEDHTDQMKNDKTSAMPTSPQTSKSQNTSSHNEETLTHSPKTDVTKLQDSQPTKLVCEPSIEQAKIDEKQNMDQSTSRKGETNVKELESDKHTVLQDKTSENSENDTTSKQASVIAGVDEDMDYEFLMECTDSQLISEEVVLEEQSIASDVKNSRAQAKELTSGKQDKATTMSDFDTEDGSLLINELMREVASLKNFLKKTYEQFEQMKKSY